MCEIVCGEIADNESKRICEVKRLLVPLYNGQNMPSTILVESSDKHVSSSR
jgi:hypothetical protein